MHSLKIRAANKKFLVYRSATATTNGLAIGNNSRLNIPRNKQPVQESLDFGFCLQIFRQVALKFPAVF